MNRLVVALLLLSVASPALAEGEGIYGPVPLQRKDAEMMQKAGEMEELFQRRGYVLPADAPETLLVQRVGERVVKGMSMDPYVRFRFHVLNNPIPNAFALPDGQIYIHQGLLAILENEAQLASVLAHEAVHVEGHHSIVNARQARKKQGAMVAMSVVLGDIGNLINIAFYAAILGYGRDLEKESDVRGLDRTLAAGYDPREMPRVFELLDQDPEGERGQVKAVWSDHPLGVQRSAYTTELLAGMAPRIEAAGELRIGQDDFLRDAAPSTRQSVRDFIAADRPRTALGLAKRLVERWPDDADDHVLVGASYRALDARTPVPAETELTKAAKKASRRERSTKTPYERTQERLAQGDRTVLQQNRELAREAFEKALSLAPGHLEATLGLARLDEDEGATQAAGRRYVEWLRAAPPEAGDRPVVVRRLADITARLEAQVAAQGGK